MRSRQRPCAWPRGADPTVAGSPARRTILPVDASPNERDPRAVIVDIAAFVGLAGIAVGAVLLGPTDLGFDGTAAWSALLSWIPVTLPIAIVVLAACFITDLGTVLALGFLFADFNPLLAAFGIATVVTFVALPRVTGWLLARVPGRVSEPEIKFLFLVLFLLGGLAQAARSEAVLPAYLLGLAVAGVFVGDRVVVHRMRAIAFSLLTPFYFIKAGLLVSLPAVVSGAGLIAALLAVKVGAKVVGVWPTARAFRMPVREANYTTLLMSTGLTFGTISALYGFTNGYIDQAAYTVLVTVVILSAVIPTIIATTFFEPRRIGADAVEDVDAAEEIDAGPLPRPRGIESA